MTLKPLIRGSAQTLKGPLRWSRLRQWAAGLVLLALSLGLWAYLLSRAHPLAVLTHFSGQPERDFSATVGEWRRADPGDSFLDGDAARADVQTTAHFRLGHRARLVLRPASQVRFGKRAGTGALGVTVELGQVDVGTEADGVRLSSVFGELSVAPKSLIALRRDGTRLIVGVTLGRLELASDPKRTWIAGQSVTLELGGVLFEDSAPKLPSTAAPAQTSLETGAALAGSDLVVSAGDSFWVHDPSPPTRIGFRFETICSGPGRVSAGELAAAAVGQATLGFEAGKHRYELRCLADADRIAASGQFEILKDKGSRPLPTYTPSATVHADGRTYSIYYQERLPQVTVIWPGAPPAESYSLTMDGGTTTHSGATVSFPAGKLGPGVHELVFSAPPRASRRTTIEIRYDAQAPTARVAEPLDRFEPGTAIPVTGQAMPGFSVSVDGRELELDAHRRFSTEAKPSGTLVLAFSHAGRGTHYYLRRPKESLP